MRSSPTEKAKSLLGDRVWSFLKPARSCVRAAQARAPRRIKSIDAEGEPLGDGVDVRQLLDKLTVEELAEAADDYYVQNIDGADYYFAKPFGSPSETPDLLITFGQVLNALALTKGMKVLDFGAGTGWTSRYMSQMGCEVVVSDVSATALRLAAELYERLPVIGNTPAPTFHHFNGYDIELDDASVDRVLCFDALHHTPNPDRVIAEMGRVLRPGGIAAFSEPGPNHSKMAQSQFEMKNYTVIENDIRMREIEKWASRAGFDEVKLSVFTAEPHFLTPDQYERLLAGRREASAYLWHHRPFLETRRVFHLVRQGEERRDSRHRDGLHGTIAVSLGSGRVEYEGGLTGNYSVVNTGRNHWLPSTVPHGKVLLGVHLYDADGKLIDRDFGRVDLDRPDGVEPGAQVDGTFTLPTPPAGSYLIEFDLVAEGVAWFEVNGTETVRLPIEVA